MRISRHPRLRSAAERGNLTPDERKSLTHGDFRIPDVERETYKRALQVLNEAGIPYVVAGAYAIYAHTGIYRQIKDRTADHWPLLLAQLQVFNYVCPSYRTRIPRWVLEDLLERARQQIGRDEPPEDLTRGTLISRFSFAIDVREWGFRSPRGALIETAKSPSGNPTDT